MSKSKNRSVGIFAGTFDPIHEGHVAVASLARKECFLDNVYFAVEARPWGAKQPVAVTHRQKMVDLAIQEIPGLEQIHLQDERFNIQTTLPRLIKQFPDCTLFFIFGADVFLNMSAQSWPGLSDLLKHHLIVFERGNTTEKAINDHAKKLGISIAILPSGHLHHSSTRVRTSSPIEHIPLAVEQYITDQKLY